MSLEEKQDLTAIQAVGGLDGEDCARLESLLAAGDPEAKQMLAEFTTVAAPIAAARPASSHPSPGLKQRILAQILFTEHGCTALLVVPLGDYLPAR